MGSIDETAIGNLSFVAQLSNHIHISKQQSDGNPQDETSQFHKIFPSFMWVIRDFSLNLVDEDGDPITGTQYLNNSLQPVKGFDKQTSERNRIRSMLTNFFSARQCVTLVRPCNSEESLQQVDKIPFTELRSEFQSGMQHLRSLIFDNLIPKSLEGRVLNGLMFAGLVESYVQAVNTGGVPTLSTAWDSISEEESLTAYNKAIELYEADMNEFCDKKNLPKNTDEFTSSSSVISAKAINFFKSRAVGVSSQQYLEKLQLEIEELLEVYNSMNSQASKTFCTQLIDSLYNKSKIPNIILSEDQIKDSSFINVLKEEWDGIVLEYNQSPSKGPANLVCLSDFYYSRFFNILEMATVSLKDGFGKEIRKLQSEIRDLASDLNIIRTERDMLEVSKRDLESKLNESERDKLNFSSKCSQQEAIISNLTNNIREAKKVEQSQIDILERSDSKIKELQSKLSDHVALVKESDELKLLSAKQAEEIKHMKEALEATSIQAQLTEQSYEKLLIKLGTLMATDEVERMDYY